MKLIKGRRGDRAVLWFSDSSRIIYIQLHLVVHFSNCKINIGLEVLQKRTDGFHNLQTIFYPLPIFDAGEIIEAHSLQVNDVDLTMTGLVIDIPAEENICVKAYQLLKKDFPCLPKIKMHLHKTIPTGAGLGGGSANGATALLLLQKKFNLDITTKKLAEYALQLGSDCPFFITNKPCIATGRGEIIEEIDLGLSNYTIVIVNPGIHVNTQWAFSKICPSSEKISFKQLIKTPVTDWQHHFKNDFEEPVFAAHPEIANIKKELLQKGAVYASMTGSGSTVYGIFEKEKIPVLDFPAHYFVRVV